MCTWDAFPEAQRYEHSHSCSKAVPCGDKLPPMPAMTLTLSPQMHLVGLQCITRVGRPPQAILLIKGWQASNSLH